MERAEPKSGDVALVYEAFAALQDGGVEALVPYVHPDFEGVVPPEVSAEPDIYRGHAGIRRYFALWNEDIEDLTFAPMNLVEADGAVVVLLRITGRGRGSGAPAELITPTRLTIVDGRLRTMQAYETIAAAQAGR